MELRLEIAGGLAHPLGARRYVIDTASLPAAQRAEVEKVAALALAEPRREANARLRDARSYELTIVSEAGEQTVVASDGAMPPTLRQLIELIRSVASPPKP